RRRQQPAGLRALRSRPRRGGVTWEGTEGWVWANRGRHDAHPKAVLTSRIEPGEIHLYESEDHYRNFIDCVLSRQETAAPAEVAHRSITICHLGNIALRLGRKVLKWDPAKEEVLGDPEAQKMLRRPYRAPWKLG